MLGGLLRDFEDDAHGMAVCGHDNNLLNRNAPAPRHVGRLERRRVEFAEVNELEAARGVVDQCRPLGGANQRDLGRKLSAVQ